MDIDLLHKQFGRIGARLRVTTLERPRQVSGIDIGSDQSGEYFDIRLNHGDPVIYDVVDLQPKLRHLLLLGRHEGNKEKFLCGHDERHWFVCAVPGQRGVTGVVSAMQALQPSEVRALAERTVRPKERLLRHNAAFVRQGEWFFVPEPEFQVDERLIHHNEPISRGRGSKPHMCQFLYRFGGETVMVCSSYPSGITLERYRKIVQAQPDAARWGWRQMKRNAAVYARGRISHPDHQTIVLEYWSRVLMNTENEAPGKSNVVFLD